MPFSINTFSSYRIVKSELKKRIVENKIKKVSLTLQVLRQRNILKKISLILRLKRVFLFTSQMIRKVIANGKIPRLKTKKLKAGISLEAAIVTSVFMFATLAVVSVLCILNLQNSIQIVLENTGREIAQNIYYAEEFKDTLNENDALKKVNDALLQSNDGKVDEGALEKIDEAAFDIYVYGKFVSTLGTKYINDSYILGGVAGLDFSKSKLDEENGTVDIILDYTIEIPFVPTYAGIISDRKRVCVKAWNGTDITKDSKIVYITEDGNVYHTLKECSHINVNVTKATYGQLESLRNSSGEIYDKCKYCKKTKYTDASVIYITKYGDSYHSSLSCGGISRSAIAIDIKQIGSRKLCKDCEKGTGTE